MSRHNPKSEWLLVELTVSVVVFSAGLLLIVRGCPASAHGQQLATVPAGQFRADVSGETLDERLAQQRQQLGLGETQYTCQPGRSQYVQGPPGQPGPVGPQGEPGVVDYTKVQQMIEADHDALAAQLNQALAEWRADANGITVDLGNRINNNAAVIGQWSSEIESLDSRLSKLETSTAPGGVAGLTPTSAPPGFSLGDSWISAAAIGLLGAAGVAVPWWAVLLIREAWRAYRTTHQPPAVGRPPVQPFRTTDTTVATSTDTGTTDAAEYERFAGNSDEPPDGYYEDGE